LTDRANDVVITGVGLCSAAPGGLVGLESGLLAGRCFASPLATVLPVPGVAAVTDRIEEDPDFPDDRKAWLAFEALRRAWRDSGLDLGGAPASERLAVFLGTGLSSVTPHELEEDIYPHRAGEGFDRQAMSLDLVTTRAAPRRHLPGRVTEEIARRLGAGGPVGTSFSACAAAAQAIAEGLWAIRRGEVDVAVVGGHDSMIHPVGLLSFVVLGALSPVACRPFDRERDGFLIGEGAGLLVLESGAHARARGARVRARLLGAGTSADAWNVTAPHPEGEGAERAMRRALRDGGLAPDEVAYVNAHGTGTPVGDVAEAKAIHRVFGHGMRVSSIKGAIGHTIAAAGAVEAAACVAALEGGWLPGNVGSQEPDPACPIEVLRHPVREGVRHILSNSFGFGGQNCCLLFGRADGG
jgi:3-oxoacyl-[acyl-carrier-protein] synthase II